MKALLGRTRAGRLALLTLLLAVALLAAWLALAGQAPASDDFFALRLAAAETRVAGSLLNEVWQIDEAGVGPQKVLDASPHDLILESGPLDTEHEVCFQGDGGWLLVDGGVRPMRQIWLRSYRQPEGMTCALMDRRGMMMIITGEPPLSMAPRTTAVPAERRLLELPADSLDSQRPLADCVVFSIHTLNLRERPAGRILGAFGGEGFALARTPNWFKITAEGIDSGWVSANFVYARGDCD
ncbi:MAG: hypothetical protein F4X02_15705 [Chloroflexi bacterium]|nr:hypothetical protein [Chloroflexota bacterium]